MEIRIGVQNVSREMVVEVELTADAVAKLVSQAVEGGTLDLTDTKGRRILVPSGAIGYVDMGEETKRRVGFEA